MKMYKSIARIMITAFVLASGSARAMSVTVANYSFEAPVVGLGGSAVTPAPWFGTGGQGIFGTAQASDGVQVAFVGTHNPTPASMFQDVGLLLPDTRYTLTVDVGGRDVILGATGFIELVNGTDLTTGTLLSFTPVSGASATLAAQTTTFETGDSVSGDLTIGLTYNSASGQMLYDNVRLDAFYVPEPSTFLLMGIGGLALWFRRRAFDKK